MRVLKPIVAESLPNLYSAASRANLIPEEQNQIEQMSWTVKKNKELSILGNWYFVLWCCLDFRRRI